MAKRLVSDSEDAVKGVGQLKSKADAQAHGGEQQGHGVGKEKNHDKNGKSDNPHKKG